MKETMYIKKLDAANLQRMLRCDPARIQAEEATPEAIETCRMAGVELLLAPGEPHIDDATRAIYEEGRKLGVRVVLATSDLSGLKNASAEEAEKILDNATVKIRLDISKQADEAPMSKHEYFLTQMEQVANSNGRANHFDDMVTICSLDLMNLIRIIRGEPKSIGISDAFASSDYAGLRKAK